MARDKIDHPHGDTGVKPPDALDFQGGDFPDPTHFDWFWDTVGDVVDGHADEFDVLDSDGDGVVDKADFANDADASSFKGNDIDSDGDGVVDKADNALAYKGNDIDSDGDGSVDDADGVDGVGLTIEKTTITLGSQSTSSPAPFPDPNQVDYHSISVVARPSTAGSTTEINTAQTDGPTNGTSAGAYLLYDIFVNLDVNILGTTLHNDSPVSVDVTITVMYS